MDDRKQVVANHYKPLLNKYAKGYEILDWENLDSQISRFKVLIDNANLVGKKLLDIGSGIGSLYNYLIDKKVEVDYYGIDILPEMINRAREIYPKGNFFTGNIFKKSPFRKKQFDIIFCSGVFNLNMGDNESFLKEAIPVFFIHAKEKVVFNLLESGNFEHNEKYYFFNQKKVLSLIRDYTDNAIIVTDYIPNDFTIIAEVNNARF